jgi:hypothetical protein
MCELIYGIELKNLNNVSEDGIIIYLTLDIIQVSLSKIYAVKSLL